MLAPDYNTAHADLLAPRSVDHIAVPSLPPPTAHARVAVVIAAKLPETLLHKKAYESYEFCLFFRHLEDTRQTAAWTNNLTLEASASRLEVYWSPQRGLV